MNEDTAAPSTVDRATFQGEVDALRIREKAHTREGDAIAAARRRLPMVEVNAAASLIGEHGQSTLLQAFEGRRIRDGEIPVAAPARKPARWQPK